MHPSRRTGLSLGGGILGASGNISLHGSATPGHSNQLSRANSAGNTPFGSFTAGVPSVRSPRGEVIVQQQRQPSSAGRSPEGGSSFKLFHRRAAGAAAAASASPARGPSPSGLFCSPFGGRAASGTNSPSIIDNQAGHQVQVTPANAYNAGEADMAAANLGRVGGSAVSTTLNPTLGSSSKWYSQGILGPATAPAGGATGSSGWNSGADTPASAGSGRPVRGASKGGAAGGGTAGSPGGEYAVGLRVLSQQTAMACAVGFARPTLLTAIGPKLPD